MGRGYTLYNIYRGGVLDVSFELSVVSYRRTRRSRNGWHLKKDEKLRKASQARNIINANFANLANYTNCSVLKKVYRLILSHVQMTGDVEPSSLLLKSARGSMPLQASVTV